MDLAALERACEIVVRGSTEPAIFAQANAQVMTLQSSVENIPTLQAVFDASSNSCAILVAARCLQHLITENWNAFTEPQRVDIRDYLLNFLGTKGLNLEEFAVKGVVALICRITKFGWFDAPTDVPVPPPTGNAAADAAAAAAAAATAGMRGIVSETTKFLQATVSHCLIGLRILNDLVTEMNYKSKNRSMTQQRKVAVSFRDASLFQIFEISLSMLNQVATRSIALDALPPHEAAKTEDKIIEYSLQLLISCLSFDFLGSNPDEDVGDTTSIQVPASWRERLQSGSTLRVLFNLYKGCTTGRISLIPDAPAPSVTGSSGTPSAGSSSSSSTFGSSSSSLGGSSSGGGFGSFSASGTSSNAPDSSKKGGLFGYKPFGGLTATTTASGQVAAPTREMRVSFPRAAQCLDALNLMVAVRRSLFSTEGDRKRFLSYIIRGVCEILREEAGFTDEACFHNFSKLLNKIKNSFQLSELVVTEGYQEWISLTAAFTIKCCSQPAWSQNSMHYILGLWTRLVSSVPYMQAEYSTKGISSSSSSSSSSTSSNGGKGNSGIPEVHFDAFIPKIVAAYIRGRLEVMSAGAGGDSTAQEEVLEQLDDLETIEDELEQLPAMCRYTYEQSASQITAIMDPILSRYNDGLTFLRTAGPNQNVSQALATLKMLECQLAWLVAIIGAVVGGAGSGISAYSYYTSISFGGGGLTYSTVGGNPGASGGNANGTGLSDDNVDADLIRRVLQLMQATDMRLSAAAAGAAPSSTAGGPSSSLVQMMRVDTRLELAFIFFLGNFRKAYVNEQGGLPSSYGGSATSMANAAAAAAAAGASAGKAQGLLSSNMAVPGQPPPRSAAEAAAQAAAAVAAEQPTLQEMYSMASGRQKVFLGMVIRMGLGDHTVVVSLMITKLMNNLRFWPERQDIIDRTLEVLNELIFSYSSGRLLLQLDVINNLLMAHGEEHFPFLNNPSMARQRTLFHSALARLVFMEDESDKFEPFMQPIVTNLERLSRAASLKNQEVMRTVIGVSRDLRGVLQAAHNRPTYMQVFDLIFPKHIQTLAATLNTWWDTPAVTTSVLKCFNELCFNRGQRITFGSSSANGILLFREASNAMVAYGQRIGTVTPPPHEAYPLKYKGISTALSLFSHCLDGGYVNFGVFQLYGDPALTAAFETILKLVLSLPSNEVLELPKFAMQWLSFLTHAFRSHMETLVSLDTGSFMALIQTLTQGLDSVDTEIASQAAYSLDFFATFYVKNSKKDTPAMTALRGHLAAQPMLFEALMKVVFQVVVFGDIGNAWALPRPLLSLILAAELVRPNCFEAFKNEVVAMQPQELQPRLQEEFTKLMKDITRSLDVVNRDRFQNRTTIFRVAVKEFAKVP